MLNGLLTFESFTLCMLFDNMFNSRITKGTPGIMFRQLLSPALTPTPPICSGWPHSCDTRHYEKSRDSQDPARFGPAPRPKTKSLHRHTPDPTTSPNLQTIITHYLLIWINADVKWLLFFGCNLS